jgi:antitoxin Phd
MRSGAERREPALGRLTGWKLEEAKARFSELVRRAHAEGPQRVTVYGRDAVVVLSAEAYTELVGRKDRPDLASLLAGSPLSRLELEPAHEASPVREVGL